MRRSLAEHVSGDGGGESGGGSNDGEGYGGEGVWPIELKARAPATLMKTSRNVCAF